MGIRPDFGLDDAKDRRPGLCRSHGCGGAVRGHAGDLGFDLNLREQPDVAFLSLQQVMVLNGPLAFQIPSSYAHADDLVSKSPKGEAGGGKPDRQARRVNRESAASLKSNKGIVFSPALLQG